VLQVLDLGATMHSLEVTCGDGVRRNVLLGHATPQEHLDSTDYLGGTIGRYANRIAAGRFTLEGVEYQLGTHDRGNHLHGGRTASTAGSGRSWTWGRATCGCGSRARPGTRASRVCCASARGSV
jgi:hypothetical protein